MNDFVALLLAVAAFCLAFVTMGASVRVAVALDVAPYGLAEGSFVQFALAALAAHLAWRRLHPPSGDDDPYRA